MITPPSNPVLQALAGAQTTGHLKPQPSTVKTETVRPVTANEASGESKDNELQLTRDQDDVDMSKPKPRGSLVNVVI